MRRFPFPNIPEFKRFAALDTPAKIQDFLNALPINFEKSGDTCRSPLAALQHGEIHCLEGALLAAAICWYQGRPPLIFDLETTLKDESHVVALFKENTRWGALSKTNHAVLRFRDPVYATLRELALSYFHEYFLDDGTKTLRAYSKKPFDLLDFEDEWLIAEYPVWGIHDELVYAPHVAVAPRVALKRLRPADPIERVAGKSVEWKEY